MDRRQNKQGRKKFPAIAHVKPRERRGKTRDGISNNTFFPALRHRPPSPFLSPAPPPPRPLYSASRENTSEEFSATRSRWYPEGNLLTRSKFSSRKSFEKSHPEFKGKPFIWDLQYGTLSPPLRHFIPSSFFLSSRGIAYLRLYLYHYYFRSMHANLNASERYGVLKLIISNISSDFLISDLNFHDIK